MVVKICQGTDVPADTNELPPLHIGTFVLLVVQFQFRKVHAEMQASLMQNLFDFRQ
jgi:hypothetical protein